MPTFAERLQELREKAGLTQAQLAEKSGLPLGSIRNYEQGQREPYWNVLFKLAGALGVKADAFADCVSKDETAGKGKGESRAARRRPAPAARPRAAGKGK
jgi:transcriptional regulator with XRE-family HTH domain